MQTAIFEGLPSFSPGPLLLKPCQAGLALLPYLLLLWLFPSAPSFSQNSGSAPQWPSAFLSGYARVPHQCLLPFFHRAPCLGWFEACSPDWFARPMLPSQILLPTGLLVIVWSKRSFS